MSDLYSLPPLLAFVSGGRPFPNYAAIKPPRQNLSASAPLQKRRHLIRATAIGAQSTPARKRESEMRDLAKRDGGFAPLAFPKKKKKESRKGKASLEK